VLLLYIDSKGAFTWARTAGGDGADYARSLALTGDGGYIVAGYTDSFGAGSRDALLLKYTANGSLSWVRTAGGSSDDLAYSVMQTADGGYIVAGQTESYGAGNWDVFLLKYTSEGTLSWARTTGGSNYESGRSIAQTSDGGYIVAGVTSSYGAGGSDVFLLKFSSEDSLSWAKTIGGDSRETANSIKQTKDGGYIVVGETLSLEVYWDFLIIKLAADGTLSWVRTAEIDDGLEREAQATSVAQTADGGYLVAGYSERRSWGANDAMSLKFASDGALTWSRVVGWPYDRGDDVANAALLAKDGGYIIAGSSPSDVLLVKMKADGEIPFCPACVLAPVLTTSPPLELHTYNPTVETQDPVIGLYMLESHWHTLESKIICDGYAHLYLPLVVR
jgi:uncharacterized delta-60 repeat protein